MRLLITGSTGFVGRNLVLEALKDPGYSRILLPVRSPEKLKKQFLEDKVDLSKERVDIIECEAPSWKSIENLEVEQAIHCAGVIFARTWEEYYTVNTVGTLNLIEKLSADVPIVALSSLAAAGPCEGPEVEKVESSNEKPVTWYGRSKLEMEKQLSARFPERKIVYLRPPMIFGARDNATLPLFKMVRGPVQFKSGLRKKSYSYISVRDLSTGIFACLKQADQWPGVEQRHYFINSKDIIHDDELIRVAAEVSNRQSRIIRIPQPVVQLASRLIDSIPTWRATIPSLSVDRAKEIWPDRWVASASAFESRFGWSPSQDFREVVRETHDWYQRSGQLV